jgi:hypothetical protein
MISRDRLFGFAGQIVRPSKLGTVCSSSRDLFGATPPVRAMMLVPHAGGDIFVE